MSKGNKNKRKRKPRHTTKTRPVKRIDVSISELEEIIERAAKGPLNEQDCQALLSVSQTLHFLTEQLEEKGISIGRLRKLLFGAPTEKLDKLTEKASEQNEAGQDDKDTANDDKPEKEKPKGHGRNGADAYTGAQKVKVSHETLKPGDSCPACTKGTVYETAKPGRIVRVTGHAPLTATVYELQKVRCNLCNKVFTAAGPKDVGPEKYDPESISMIALLKYGTGMPFNRLEQLQRNLGIPLSASTQWDTLSKHEHAFAPLYQAYIVAAAQGKIVHNDDTTMKVLDLPDLSKSDKGDSDRKGVFTSGIVSIGDDHLIALFFTGHQHAGENLADVLKYRASELTAPIQMSDALSRNVPVDFKTLLANCLAHGRRRFTDVFENFPLECQYVLELLAKVYKNDKIARQQNLSDQNRLHLHQMDSGPLMDELKDWMTKQLDEKLIEPNSGLGEAITYMLKHWQELTLFLRCPGAPLDNNICERALKKAILHRKNAYYYKTENGARVGDMFMSLIHTCELNTINPFNYLTEIQKHAGVVASCPNDWMPWNYQETLEKSKAVANA